MVVNGQNKWRRRDTKTDSVGEAESVAIAVLNGSLEIDIGDGLANGAFVDPGFLIDQASH